MSRPFPPSTWFAVYKVGDGLRLLQPFTEDRALLPGAIEAATKGADRPRDPVVTSGTPVNPGPDNSTEEALGWAQYANVLKRTGANLIDMLMAQKMAEALRHADVLYREQRGQGSLYPLLAVARGLSAVSGRKTLLYFSEGLNVPPSVAEAMSATVSQANRSNVAIYSIDASGLRVHSPSTESKMALQLATDPDGTGLKGEEGSPAVVGLDAIRLNLQGNLQDLAESTGGFLIANSNDLRTGLERVAGDLRSFYEIAYVPPNPAPDGRFRTILVKVSRPGVTVRTRRGYYALPPGAAVVLPYELALSQALEGPKLPRDFDHRVATLHFADSSAERETTLVVEVPLAGLRFTRDEAAGTYRARVSLLGLVKDPKGQLVARLSHDWPLEGPIAEAEATQQRTTMVKRTLRLPPGRYTLETAVQDRESGSLSARRTPFEVPAASPGLALGSIVMVRAEDVPADASGAAGTGDPLQAGRLRAVPSLGKPIPQGTPAVSLFLSLHPERGTDPVEVTIELRRDGQTVAQAKPELPAPDARGRIAYIGSFPAGRLAPGRYEVWARAKQGSAEAAEATSFTISPAPAAATPSLPPSPAFTGGGKPPASDLVPILEAAAQYVHRYAETFGNVVAQEVTRQWSQADQRHTRALRSDLLFVTFPTGPIPWATFRDVFEVDGQAVRDREARLEKIFRSYPPAEAVRRANALVREGTRQDIGRAYRTVNIPTLALLFLSAENQPRFSFTRRGERFIGGFHGVEVAFEEKARPTIVHDGDRHDLPVSGRFWIDPDRGTVLRSEATYRFGAARALAVVSTEYRRESGLDIFVPSEMKELYYDEAESPLPVFHDRVEATSRYSDYRRFEVSVEEKAKIEEE